MKRAEVELPDPLYQQVKGLAQEKHLSISDLLRQAAEQLVQRQAQTPPGTRADNWHFPEGRHLGAFLAPAEDWRLLANENGG
jgi:predicted transcriptional regulator